MSRADQEEQLLSGNEDSAEETCLPSSFLENAILRAHKGSITVTRRFWEKFVVRRLKESAQLQTVDWDSEEWKAIIDPPVSGRKRRAKAGTADLVETTEDESELQAMDPAPATAAIAPAVPKLTNESITVMDLTKEEDAELLVTSVSPLVNRLFNRTRLSELANDSKAPRNLSLDVYIQESLSVPHGQALDPLVHACTVSISQLARYIQDNNNSASETATAAPMIADVMMRDSSLDRGALHLIQLKLIQQILAYNAYNKQVAIYGGGKKARTQAHDDLQKRLMENPLLKEDPRFLVGGVVDRKLVRDWQLNYISLGNRIGKLVVAVESVEAVCGAVHWSILHKYKEKVSREIDFDLLLEGISKVKNHTSVTGTRLIDLLIDPTTAKEACSRPQSVQLAIASVEQEPRFVEILQSPACSSTVDTPRGGETPMATPSRHTATPVPIPGQKKRKTVEDVDSSGPGSDSCTVSRKRRKRRHRKTPQAVRTLHF